MDGSIKVMGFLWRRDGVSLLIKKISKWIMSLTMMAVSSLFIPSQTEANAVEIEPISLTPEEKRTIMSENLFILEDKEKEWTIDDIIDGPISEQFTKNTMNTPNFGYTSSVYWTRFTLINLTVVIVLILVI